MWTLENLRALADEMARDQSLDPDRTGPCGGGMGPGRQVAVAPERRQEGPLGVEAPTAQRILEVGEQTDDGVVVGTALHGQRSLGDLGQHHLGLEQLGA